MNKTSPRYVESAEYKSIEANRLHAKPLKFVRPCPKIGALQKKPVGNEKGPGIFSK